MSLSHLAATSILLAGLLLRSPDLDFIRLAAGEVVVSHAGSTGAKGAPSVGPSCLFRVHGYLARQIAGIAEFRNATR